MYTMFVHKCRRLLLDSLRASRPFKTDDDDDVSENSRSAMFSKAEPTAG